MKKKVVLGAALMMMPLVSFAGGYLTNTNQHAAFLRSLSRGAAIDIDGALSNPAGLSFLPTDGFRIGVSIQSAFQTRDIDASFSTYNGFDPVNKVPTVSDVPYKKYYKGKAAAPVIPSVFAAYKKGDWTISGFFAITGGGGKASFDDGLPMFESAAMAGIFKATVASTMYDMSRVNANGYFDAEDSADDRNKKREMMNVIRTRDAQSGTITPGVHGLPDSITGEEPQFVKDYFDYYKTNRGFHVRSINSNGAWSPTMTLSFINMPLLSYIHEISRPVLLIHGENAHSRYFSEDAFKKLTGDNKELMIIPGANHTDLYDRTIPFDKLEDFFRKNLK